MSKFAVIGKNPTSFFIAYQLLKKHPNAEVLLFSSKADQKITEPVDHDGCVMLPEFDYQTGWSTEVADILREVGLLDSVVRSEQKNHRWQLAKDGMLLSAPEKASRLYRSSLLFITEKIKLFFALRKHFSLWANISLFQAGRIMVGESFAEQVISPFIRRWFYADAEDLELGGAIPLAYAQLAEGKTLKEILSNGDVSLFPRGWYAPKGMADLMNRFEDLLKSRGLQVTTKTPSRFKGNGTIFCGSHEFSGFEKIFIGTEPYDVAEIFKKDYPDLFEVLGQMPTRSLSSVYLGYNSQKYYRKGAGFMVPRKEKLAILFCDYFSNQYLNRYPSETFLIRNVIAGDTIALKDDDLIEFAHDAHRKYFRLTERPKWAKVFRNAYRFTPETPGFSEKVTIVKKHLESLPSICFPVLGVRPNLADLAQSISHNV